MCVTNGEVADDCCTHLGEEAMAQVKVKRRHAPAGGDPHRRRLGGERRRQRPCCVLLLGAALAQLRVVVTVWRKLSETSQVQVESTVILFRIKL